MNIIGYEFLSDVDTMTHVYMWTLFIYGGRIYPCKLQVCWLFKYNCMWCMGVWGAIMYLKVLHCTCWGLSSWNRLSWLVNTTWFSAMVSLTTVLPYLSFHIRPGPHVSISVSKDWKFLCQTRSREHGKIFLFFLTRNTEVL